MIFGAKFVNLINKKPVELLAKVENVISSESKRDEYTILPLVLYLEWVNHFEDFVGLVVYVPFFFPQNNRNQWDYYPFTIHLFIGNSFNIDTFVIRLITLFYKSFIKAFSRR